MTDERRCADCTVRELSLCGALEDRQLAELNRIGQRRKLRRGETLCWSGEANATCANLLSGVLKLTASAPDGREQAVGIKHPADFIGQPFADRHEFTVTAVSDAEVCTFPRPAFRRILEGNAVLERELLTRTFQTLNESRRQMLMLGRHSAEEKVAGFLCDCARREGTSRATPQGPITFDLPLSRGEMAELLGLTIETVSRQLTKLRVAGLIATPAARTITVRNEASLAARAGGGR